MAQNIFADLLGGQAKNADWPDLSKVSEKGLRDAYDHCTLNREAFLAGLNNIGFLMQVAGESDCPPTAKVYAETGDFIYRLTEVTAWLISLEKFIRLEEEDRAKAARPDRSPAIKQRAVAA